MDSKKLEKVEMNPKELEPGQLEKVSGGIAGMSTCNHLKFIYLGQEKEVSYFIFWTKHAWLARCVNCGEEFWTYQHP